MGQIFKYQMKSTTIVVVWPYGFRPFDWQRLEIEYLYYRKQNKEFIPFSEREL